MAKHDLSTRKVAVLVAEGFEQVEFTQPVEALEEAGATVVVIAPSSGKVKAWDDEDWGGAFDVDVVLDEARAEDYDALLLPGGVMSPDNLRQEEAAVRFARHFFEAKKPVASICHGPQLLINADVVRGRRMTSYPSIRQDLVNAGAHWVDEEVVVDQGFVTSRRPADLDAFCDKMVEEIAEGKHAGQHA